MARVYGRPNLDRIDTGRLRSPLVTPRRAVHRPWGPARRRKWPEPPRRPCPPPPSGSHPTDRRVHPPGKVPDHARLGGVESSAWGAGRPRREPRSVRYRPDAGNASRSDVRPRVHDARRSLSTRTAPGARLLPQWAGPNSPVFYASRPAPGRRNEGGEASASPPYAHPDWSALTSWRQACRSELDVARDSGSGRTLQEAVTAINALAAASNVAAVRDLLDAVKENAGF